MNTLHNCHIYFFASKFDFSRDVTHASQNTKLQSCCMLHTDLTSYYKFVCCSSTEICDHWSLCRYIPQTMWFIRF